MTLSSIFREYIQCPLDGSHKDVACESSFVSRTSWVHLSQAVVVRWPAETRAMLYKMSFIMVLGIIGLYLFSLLLLLPERITKAIIFGSALMVQRDSLSGRESNMYLLKF